MRNRRVIWAVVALVAIAVIVAGFYFATAGSNQPTVKTAKVASEPLSVTVTASGKVAADVKSDVFPPTQGTLASVSAKDGEFVHAGDVLATLDEDPLIIAAAQARTSIEQAEAQAATARDQMPSGADIRAADANVSSTRYSYNLANSTYQALKAAAEISGSRSAEASAAIAKQSKLQAFAGYRQAVAGRVKLGRTSALFESVGAARAAQDQGAAALRLARKQLAAVDLTSPIDGYVVFNAMGAPSGTGAAPTAGVGAAVAPAAAPFTVYALSSTFFSAEVDETDVGKVKPGLATSVTLDAFPGESFSGKVERIAPLAILTTSGGTAFPVLIPLSAVKRPIRIGMQGNADIKISSIEAATTIPIEALFDEGGKSYVYVVTPANRLKKTEVTVGTLTDTEAQIKTGVSPGATVALSGTVKLTDGLAIKPQ